MAARITLSIGLYSQIPYVIPGIEIPVYCIEELCVAVRENAMLIDDQIMNKSLIEWISRDLSLRELADALLGIMNSHGSVSDFCRYFLEYTGLFDRAEVYEITKLLAMGVGMSVMERQKKQADTLAEHGNYEAAIHAYKNIIEKWSDAGDTSSDSVTILMGNIYNNLGVSYAGMMKYSLAALAFKKAGECDPTPEHRHSYTAALRLSMSGTDFIKYVALNPELGPDSIAMEGEIEKLTEEYETEGEGMSRMIMKNAREQMDRSEIASDNEKILDELKKDYKSKMHVN